MVIKNKAGQMKIQQMAFMLIAVMVFLSLVGLLIISVKFSGLKKKATELQSTNALLLVSKLANSPEFSCGNALGKGVSCIDADKIMALKDNLGGYKNFWGVSSIEVKKIYPSFDKDVVCDKDNYPNCNIIEVLPGQGVFYSNFVALCRKESSGYNVYNKCELAKLMVGYKNVQ